MKTLNEILAKSDPEDVSRIKRLVGETVGILDALIDVDECRCIRCELLATRRAWLVLYPEMDD